MKLLVVSLLLVWVPVGIASAQHKPASSAPLKFRIFIESKKGCSERELKLNGQITNISNNPIVIDAKLMWARIQITRSIIDGMKYTSEQRNIIGDPGPEYEPDFVLLMPKATANTSKVFSLSEVFFDQPANYSFRLTYYQASDLEAFGLKVWNGLVISNDVKVHLPNCKS